VGVALCATFLLVPLLAVANHGAPNEEAAGPDGGGRSFVQRASRSGTRGMLGEERLLSIDDSGAVGIALTAAVSTATGDPDALPITVEPDPTPTTVSKKQARSTTASTKARTHTTSTTAKPTTTTTRPRNGQTGVASWYQTFGGTCAHKSIAKGTIVTVTNLSNGLWVTCRVADRGPYVGGRIIDLDKEVFDNLAPPASGLIDVKISW